MRGMSRFSFSHTDGIKSLGVCILKAVIMAGGEGSRLRPVTCDLPKPMVPVLGRPVMEYALELLARHGIREVAVTLHYLPDSIRGYFGDGSKWGVHLHYFVEEVPLGTAGSVRAARDFLNEPFLVISGDALTDIDLTLAMEAHRQKRAAVTLVLKSVDTPVDYGVVITDGEGRVERFLEKPAWGDVFSDTVNTGIYLIEPEVMDRLAEGEKADFAKDLFPTLMEENAPLYGHLTEGYWCDIGSPGQYAAAQFDLLAGRVNVTLPLPQPEEGLWVDPSVTVPTDAEITPPCYIQAGATLEGGCALGPHGVVGRGCVIGRGASVQHSVLLDRVFVGRAAHLDHTILCEDVTVGERARLEDGSVVGASVHVGGDSVVGRGVLLWPGIRVERHARVRRSQQRGSRYPQALFDENGISGTFNEDLSAETMARLALAVGSALARGNRVGVATWGDNAAALLREAFDAGLLSTGVCCVDMGRLTLPATRFGTKRLRLDGAVHIQAQEGQVLLTVLDGRGANIDQAQEKRIQELSARGSFRRVRTEDIPEIIDISGIAVFYEQELYGGGAPFMGDRTIGVYGPDDELNHEAERVLEELGVACRRCLASVTLEEAGSHMAQDGAKIGLYLHRAGDDFALLDEQGGVYHGDRLAVLLALVAMDQDILSGTVPLPVTASRAFDEVAGNRGVTVERTPIGRSEWLRKACHSPDERLCTLFYDGVYAAIALARTLAAEGIPLSAYAARVPESFVSDQLVECPLDRRGAAMKALHARGGSTARYGGALIEEGDGRVFVWPDRQSSHLRLRTEAYRQEIADELAIHWAETLRGMATDPNADDLENGE